MQCFDREKDPKFVYYLSAEFLMGRSLLNSVYNMSLGGEFAAALNQMGYDLEALGEQARICCFAATVVVLFSRTHDACMVVA